MISTDHQDIINLRSLYHIYTYKSGKVKLNSILDVYSTYPNSGIRYPCDHCNYEATQKSALKRHKQSQHGVMGTLNVEGNYIPSQKTENELHNLYCDQCEFVTSSMQNLKQHRTFVHQGKGYPCDQCQYVAHMPSSLKVHKESKHEGIRYPCEQCEYKATQRSALKRHYQTKHDIVSYTCNGQSQSSYITQDIQGSFHSCDECQYVTANTANLRQHKRSKHEGIRYPCDQCSYAATQQSALKRHKTAKHQNSLSNAIYSLQRDNSLATVENVST